MCLVFQCLATAALVLRKWSAPAVALGIRSEVQGNFRGVVRKYSIHRSQFSEMSTESSLKKLSGRKVIARFYFCKFHEDQNIDFCKKNLISEVLRDHQLSPRSSERSFSSPRRFFTGQNVPAGGGRRGAEPTHYNTGDN